MKSFGLGLAATILLVLMPASPALSAAESESTASCYGTERISFSPGISTTSQEQTFTTHGETGTINCYGRVKGHEVTGPGTFGEDGVLEGTCSGGKGSSIISVTIPTSAGSEKLSLRATFTYGPGYGSKYGDSLMGPLTFVYYPTQGDCVTAPVTEGAFSAQGFLKS